MLIKMDICTLSYRHSIWFDKNDGQRKTNKKNSGEVNVVTSKNKFRKGHLDFIRVKSIYEKLIAK